MTESVWKDEDDDRIEIDLNETDRLKKLKGKGKQKVTGHKSPVENIIITFFVKTVINRS